MTNNANVATSTTAAAAKPRRTNRPRRGAKAAAAAADVAAPPAAPAAANPAGRVLAAFVPSKPHSCADCEACRLRKDIAATQAAIVATWQRQDELAAGRVRIADVARVPLPDAALEALLRAVIEDALAGPGVDPEHLSLLPLAAVSNAFAQRKPGGAEGHRVLEDVLRGTAGGAAARLKGVVYVAPRDEKHLRALVSLSADITDTAENARVGGGAGMKPALWSAAPFPVVVVMLAVDRRCSADGASAASVIDDYVPAALFGPTAASLVKRAPQWVAEGKLLRDGIVSSGLFGPGQHEQALLHRKSSASLSKRFADAAGEALSVLVADDVAVALTATAAAEVDQPQRFSRGDGSRGAAGSNGSWYRLENDDSNSSVIDTLAAGDDNDDETEGHPCGGAWRLFASENPFGKLCV